jgi:F-type H+-transporting ATPase subunit a
MDAWPRTRNLTSASLDLCDLKGVSEHSEIDRMSIRQRGGRLKKSLIGLLVFSILPLLPLLAINVATFAGSRRPLAAGASVESKVSPDTTSSVAEEKHGLPQKADEIARISNFPITNSLVVSWIVALSLIAFVQYATRNMKPVPEGAQNFLEWLVEGLYKFIESIMGSHLTQRTFWFFATIFIFILSANWMALIPGVGSVGWGHQTVHGFKIDQPLFRGANADVNMTLAMALVFFVLWLYWSFSEIGLLGFIKELFGPKGESAGLLRLLLIVVFFAAGCLEVVSILFRPVSLSFRLYGNIFAGENMLETMAKISPNFGWLVQVPFYFLELLMGLVQALVFMLLTVVFTLLICQHEEESVATPH